MFRFAGKLLFILLLAAAIAAGVAAFRSGDPLYAVADWASFGRFQRFDTLIADVARKYEVDPLLVKAVVWRESEFHPEKQGSKGERGLMQVGLAAASDWVRLHKVQTFQPTDLFSPTMNLEIGTWYLKQALQNDLSVCRWYAIAN